MRRYLGCLVLVLFCLAALPAAAQKGEPPKTHPKAGPQTIKLNGEVTLQLPKGYSFFDKTDADALMRYMGNPPSADGLGLVVKETADWFILFTYSSPGHISDSDAAQLNADELLQSFKEGTEQANEERKKMGAAPLELVGWADKPSYVAASHHLVWALTGRSSDGDVVNYFTRVLGREGLLSINLVCSPSDLEKNRGDLKTVIESVSFNPGQAYTDFKQGDRDSGMSLTSLILGGGAAAAAAKMGIFAKAGKLLLGLVLVGKKFIVLILVALGAGIKKLFSRGSTSEAVPPPDQDQGGPV